MSYRVAVVGATGNVGKEVLSILDERDFPLKEIYAITSSSGRPLSFGEDETLTTVALKDFDFSGIDFVFSCAGSNTSKLFVEEATQKGAIIIDKTSLFRMRPDVPLVVPEINGELLTPHPESRIIANPNCIAIPLSMVLNALSKEAPLKRAVVSTYQSVSGAGRAAMDELFKQTRAIYVNDTLEKEVFSKQIAFNVIPQIGSFLPSGSTGEETKIIEEVQKILGQNLPMAVTSVRVPVFIGHAMSVTLELDAPLAPGEARALLRESPGITVIDHHHEEGFVTPQESLGEDAVFVSRIRSDKSVPYGLSLWIACDNLRKGAALNAVQIAEALIK